MSLGLAVFFGEGLCAGVPGNTCELTNPDPQCRDCAGGQPCISQDATAVDLSPCETVVYQGRLAYFGAPRCGISDGVLGITLPNGNLVNVTPAGGIPLLASPGAFVDSNIVAYTVNPSDLDPVTQQLMATISYLGVSHASPTNGVASGSIDIFNGLSPCADNHRMHGRPCAIRQRPTSIGQGRPVRHQQRGGTAPRVKTRTATSARGGLPGGVPATRTTSCRPPAIRRGKPRPQPAPTSSSRPFRCASTTRRSWTTWRSRSASSRNPQDDHHLDQERRLRHGRETLTNQPFTGPSALAGSAGQRAGEPDRGRAGYS